MTAPALHVILAAIVIYTIIMFLMCWLIVSRGRRLRFKEDVPGPEEMRRHFVGMYYCNADDPRGWVLLKSENTKRYCVDRKQHSVDIEYSAGRHYAINMRYRSWVTAYNAVFVGGLVVIAVVGVAAPLLIR